MTFRGWKGKETKKNHDTHPFKYSKPKAARGMRVPSDIYHNFAKTGLDKGKG